MSGSAHVTDWFRFLGMNIRGTPAMPAEAVEHDLKVARERCDVLVVQEFRWPWYWKTARRVIGRGTRTNRWRSNPGYAKGLLAPVLGAQAILWKADRFKQVRNLRSLLHLGRAKISENRYLRASLLQDRSTGISFWAGSTHFVVGGDESSDPKLRRSILATDIKNLDAFLGRLVKSGHPVFMQLDANVRSTSETYDEFMAVMRKHGATLHGGLGIEYLLTIDGRETRVEVKGHWIVSTNAIRTDHEGRGITARLVRTRG